MDLFRFPTRLTALVLLLIISAGCSDPRPPDRPNILLICIDTLRADHLGCYGYHRPTSPFLDRLVEEEDWVLFEQCSAQASTTLPSHMTLFTSLYPSVHGLANQFADAENLKTVSMRSTKTLAGVLGDAGYRTAGIADGGNMSPVFGLAEGFQEYQCQYEGVASNVNRAMDWLNTHGKTDAPFFLFLHTYEVHAPYLPPSPFSERFTGDYRGWVWDYCYGEGARQQRQQNKDWKMKNFVKLFGRTKEFKKEDTEYLEALYDGEIAYTDQELARFWNFLEQEKLLDDTVVIILSDHGEAFLEHGRLGHGVHLYNEMIHVPLLFRLPPQRAAISKSRLSNNVSLLDVMPTLLDLADLNNERAPFQQGASLRPLWEGASPARERPIYAEITQVESIQPLVKSLQLGDKKLIDHRFKDQIALYDLSRDWWEKEDRASILEADRQTLQKIMDDLHAANLGLRQQYQASYADKGFDKGLQEELKQLGY